MLLPTPPHLETNYGTITREELEKNRSSISLRVLLLLLTSTVERITISFPHIAVSVFFHQERTGHGSHVHIILVIDGMN